MSSSSRTRAHKNRRPTISEAPGNASGAIRAPLAGAGRTLCEVFSNLATAPGVQHLWHHEQRNLTGARMTLSADEGKGYLELTRVGDDLYIVVGNFAYKDPRFELVPGDGLLQFYFKLSGDLTLAVSRTEPLRLNRPSLLIYHQPEGVDMSEWFAADAHERCVAINVRPSYLARNFLDSIPDAPAQLSALVSGAPGEVKYCQLPLSNHMFNLAKQILENPFTGALALIHTETLSLQLLCRVVADFSALSRIPNQEFTERELRCLHAARALLMKQLTPAPTTHEVARAAGMNDASLKRGFKAVFGETMFDFSVRCRMQHALKLLRDRSIPVAQIAAAVGYRHQASFTTAFRRHFGIRPKDMRSPKAH